MIISKVGIWNPHINCLEKKNCEMALFPFFISFVELHYQASWNFNPFEWVVYWACLVHCETTSNLLAHFFNIKDLLQDFINHAPPIDLAGTWRKKKPILRYLEFSSLTKGLFSLRNTVNVFFARKALLKFSILAFKWTPSILDILILSPLRLPTKNSLRMYLWSSAFGAWTLDVQMDRRSHSY